MGEPAREEVTAACGTRVAAPSEGDLARDPRGAPAESDLAVGADKVIEFPEGLVGFPAARRFVLLEPHRPAGPLRWLLCLDDPELGFAVAEAKALFPDYHLDPALVAGAVGAEGEEAVVLVVLTIPRGPGQMTANLLAPLVIGARSRRGRQVIVDNGLYSTRHPVFARPAG